jgi:hypothetical protein
LFVRYASILGNLISVRAATTLRFACSITPEKLAFMSFLAILCDFFIAPLFRAHHLFLFIVVVVSELCEFGSIPSHAAVDLERIG